MTHAARLCVVVAATVAAALAARRAAAAAAEQVETSEWALSAAEALEIRALELELRLKRQSAGVTSADGHVRSPGERLDALSPDGGRQRAAAHAALSSVLLEFGVDAAGETAATPAAAAAEAGERTTLDALSPDVAAAAQRGTPHARRQQLRNRQLRDLFGPYAALWERRRQWGDGAAAEAPAFVELAQRRASDHDDDLADAVTAEMLSFLEVSSGSLARGIPGLDMILKPVMFGAMKPVINTAVNMVSPSIMENVQENLQHRLTEQLPPDVARSISSKGAPILAKSLADSLAQTLARTLSPVVTKAVASKLRESLPAAISPHVITAVAETVADTVTERLPPILAARVADAMAASLGAIVTRATTQALVGTLSQVLAPLQPPPATPQAADRRAHQCEVCAAARAVPDGVSPWLALTAALEAAPPQEPPSVGGPVPPPLPPHGGDAVAAVALACYECDHGTTAEQRLSEEATLALAHAVSEYFGGYQARYLAKRGEAGAAPPDASAKQAK